MRGGIALIIGLLAGLLALAAPAVAGPEPALDRAQALYQQTEYRQALQLVEPAQPKTPAALALLGQCYFMLEDYKKSSDAFQSAVNAEGGNSVYWDWLGRAYGKRAETSSFLTAPGYASKARQHFEKAVDLNAGNLDAVDDLFEYYLEAPGFLGGGEDKAAQLAERARTRAPAKYHGMLARLAEKDKKFDVAEQEWRAAVEAAPTAPGRHVDLARFLARQNRLAESDAAFDQAAKVAPENAQVKFQRARAYIDSDRNFDRARQLLNEYLKAPLTPDDPPRAEAQKLLQKIAKG
jgi:tetratricopeptide (TPR) repeat protein